MSKFRRRRIGDIGRVITGKTPSTKKLEFFNGNYPFITIPDLDGRVVIDNSLRTLSKAGADSIVSSKLPAGAVMMSCIATVGRCGITDRVSFTNQQINSVIPECDVDSHFLYYSFSVLGRELELSGGGGSVYTNVSKRRFSDIEVPVPPLREQRAIASVLGALDDKIALNRRMNATLETMARALFRDWFVDFGPTRAKQAGEPPTLAPDLWPLFPARLDENGRPEGWEMRRVDQLMELAYGKALRAADRKPGFVPVYGSGGITGEHSEALVEGPSVIIGRKGTVGSLYWEDRSFFPIDTVFYVRPHVPLTFCYYALNTLGLDKMNTDAAVPGLNRNNAYRLEVAWPGKDLVEEFDKITHGIRERIRHNAEESRTLVRTRDLLLPRLMSGELRVAEAEELAGEVL